MWMVTWQMLERTDYDAIQHIQVSKLFVFQNSATAILHEFILTHMPICYCSGHWIVYVLALCVNSDGICNSVCIKMNSIAHMHWAAKNLIRMLIEYFHMPSATTYMKLEWIDAKSSQSRAAMVVYSISSPPSHAFCQN
ncbi:hypothetical protein O6H91_13G035600 [Diphasiastrum complanatum]|uniref:Uncharacterized protein n=1 Tax=Diphasiastrum complanatum TaxID=34168 RepID=A0ACC2BTT9_DIPCM|nr:hypothetical protein O6H91_13G035600 [Diphasiastrum complanatum]